MCFCQDMNEFTKSILPRMFKHSNFASFVRQLNKYDFHKVKAAESTVRDQSWVFRHPHFRTGYMEGLEHIRRKAPAQRKSSAPPSSTDSPAPAPAAELQDSGLIAYGTGKPDKALYDAEQNKIKAEIDALQAKLVRSPPAPCTPPRIFMSL